MRRSGGRRRPSGPARASVADEQQDVQRLERLRLDGEQVRRADRRPVIREGGPPGLTGRAGRAAPPVLLDGALADDDPELQPLAADPLGTPGRVLAGHPGDRVPHLAAEPGPAAPSARCPPPQQAPPPAVPADDRLGPDDRQVPAPVAADPARHDPEQLVAGARAGPLPGGPGQHGELLTEEQVLGDEVASAAKQPTA